MGKVQPWLGLFRPAWPWVMLLPDATSGAQTLIKELIYAIDQYVQECAA